MSFFRDIRIGTKITATLLLAVAVAVINALIGISALNATNNRLTHVVDSEAQKIKLATRINGNIAEVARAEKNIILATTQEDMDFFASYAEGYRADIQECLAHLRELADDEDQRLIDEFEVVWEECIELNHDVYDLTREDSGRRAFRLSSGEGRDILGTGEAQLDALVDKIEADLEASVVLQVTSLEEHLLAHQKVVLVARIKQNLLAMSLAEKNLILAQDAENQQAVLAVYQAERQELTERRERLWELVDEEGQGLLDEFAATIDKWRTISKQVQDLAVADTNNKGIAISQGEGREAFFKAAALMAQIVDNIEADLDAERQISDAKFSQMFILLITVSAGGIAIALLLGLLVSRSISVRLNHLVVAAGRIAGGDFEQRFTVNANDEVGVLAATFDQMTAGLLQTTAELKNEIGQRLRVEEQVREHAAQVESANRELEAFAYSVSHDLRAPLRAMDGFSSILLEEHAHQLSAEARRHLRLVGDNAQRMGKLIDDLLAFSRLGRQPLKKQRVAPAELARQALEELRAELEGRQVEITIGDPAADFAPASRSAAARTEQALPACQADPALLRQVFVNLLGNALKFTRGREVAVIQVGCRDADAGGEQVYFVKDNGVGFDMQYAHKLFGVFQRLHGVEDFAGTGVGLAIVQRVIHRHGGRVWTEAQVDKGATFYFTLGGGTPNG